MSNEYEHLTALDDPAKPWRRVWRCPATGVFVKTHAKRKHQMGFGRLAWDVTGSQCDANGAALERGDGHAILDFRHLFQVEPHAETDIAADLERELRFMVARVERAALNEEAAAALS